MPKEDDNELLISYGGTWNSFRKFINRCEAKELEKVNKNRDYRNDPFAKSKEINKKRLEIAHRAKNWEPWGQENLSIGGGEKHKKK